MKPNPKVLSAFIEQDHCPFLDGLLDGPIGHFYEARGDNQAAMDRWYTSKYNPYPGKKASNLNEKIYQIGEIVSLIPFVLPMLLLSNGVGVIRDMCEDFRKDYINIKEYIHSN